MSTFLDDHVIHGNTNYLRPTRVWPMNANCLRNRTQRQINNIESIDDNSRIAGTVFKIGKKINVVGYRKRSLRWKKRNRVSISN